MAQEELVPREGPRAPEPDRQAGPESASVDPAAETIVDNEPGSSRKPSGSGGGGSSGESQRLRCREFGEYEIISEVARGAMGIVYRARHKRLDRVVALKVLLSGEHASEAEIRRFTREAQALARLRHPNIVPIYDIGEVGGRHYFTMDFVEGTTLSKVLGERQLTVTESLGIIEQIADAASAAHGRGVIHRDVKPSNIMLDPEGGVHIMDFGLSKSTAADSKHTRDGTTIGTPAYMSPEQAKGEISRVDERSDIYSIGAVLYEMLAGRPPFGGTNLLEIVLAVINEDPPRLRAVNPRVPRELEIVVQKAMEKSPERRYRTAAELRDEVRRYRSGEPIRARPAGFWYLAFKRVRKHWAMMTVAASVIALAALSVAGFFYYRSAQRARQEYEARVQEFTAGSLPKWKPDPKFATADFRDGWESRQFVGEVSLDPATGEDRANLRAIWNARISKEMIYGNARVCVEFELPAPLKDQALGLGFAGDPALCYFRLTPGRLELMASVDPDRLAAGAPVPVAADRSMPALEPGRRYRATIERRGIELSMTLEGPDGREVASLGCAYVGFSNYRYRNLRVLLRGAEGAFRVDSLEVNRQLLPEHPSKLFAADNIFNRGDYNGAFEQYEAILAGPPPDGNADRLAEQAMTHLRMGLYYELKHDLDQDYRLALRNYAEARRLVEAIPDARVREDLERCRSEALGRELGVAGRALRAGSVGAGEFGLLLAAAAGSGGAALRGPWAQSLAPLIGEMAASGQAGPALDLARALAPPAGSLLFARGYAVLGGALVAAGRAREVPQLLARCPERPLAAPLAEAVKSAAASGGREGLNWCVSTLQSGRNAFGPGDRLLVDAARRVCDAAVKWREQTLIPAVVTAAGRDGLQESCRQAVVSLVSSAAEPRAREDALQLLSFAGDNYGFTDDTMALAAVELGRKFCKAGEYAAISRLYLAYPTPGLSDVYAEAATGVAGANPLEALAVIDEARENFPGLASRSLAEAAVRIGRAFARCDQPGDERNLFRAYDSWPDAGHIDNFVLAMDNLAGEKVKKKRFAEAGEVFAQARSRGVVDSRLSARAVACVEAAKRRAEDLEAFFRPLGALEAALAAREDLLAEWRLELAGYHLLAGNLPAAGAAYERAWAQQTRAPATAAAAELRHGLLLALRGQRPAAEKLRNARKLAEATPGAEATAFAARGVLEKDLPVEDFRKESGERRLLSPAELELVLAARAALGGDAKAVGERLAAATKALAGKEWPYELVSTEAARLAGT